MGEERNNQRIGIREGLDWANLDLEPVEAFILSRIEAGMTLDDVFYISGISREETGRVIQSLVNKGILHVDGFVPQQEEIEIDISEREKIDRFYNNLDKMNYYQILNVPFDAPLKVIKQQFYLLSKEFHPDRYFKKNIGEYRNKLEEIFKKIREAYEVLSDNVTKEIYRESTSANVIDERQRSTVASPLLDAIAERVKKAKIFFEDGMRFYNEGNFSSALNNFKLSVAYDPFNKKYKEMLTKADEQAKKTKIKTIIEQAEIKDSMGETEEAIALLEDVLRHGCDDAVVYHNLAKLYLKRGKNLQTAKNYCLKAMELDPKKAEFHITLGEIYTSAGLVRNARREFECALSLDPDNQKIKSYLEELKKKEYGKK